MEVKKGLFYAETHEWVMFNPDGTALVGISDHAQDAMGDVAFVNLCDEGETFAAGDVIGDIESIKAVSDVYSPVGGTVTKVNDALLDSPELLNSAPYDSWLIELTDVVKNDSLMDAEAYEAFIAE